MLRWVLKRVKLRLGWLPLQPTDITTLNQQDIRSPDDFWTKMSGDPTLIDHLALPDEPTQNRVVTAMAEVANYQSKRLTQSKVKNHIADVIVLLAIIAALYGVFRDRAPKPQMAQHVTVANPRGIMPFQIIRASDLRLDTGANKPTDAVSINDVVGLYAAEHLAPGTTIDRSKLSFGTKLTSEEAATIFRAKIQPTSIMNGLKPPFSISLMACSRLKNAEPCAVIDNVRILEFQSQADGISVMIAVKQEDGARLASVLGSSDLIATGPAH